MKKIAKIIAYLFGGLVLIVLLAFTFLYVMVDQEIPEGTQGEIADTLANNVLEAIHHQKYQETQFLAWTFRNKNQYVWDRFNQTVEVRWDEYSCKLLLANPGESTVFKNEVAISNNDKQPLIDKALSNFHNDSFWLVAPHKLFEPGISRKFVDLNTEQKGLLITYSSGGTTPGDSYLWKIGQNNLPVSYQMWVSILPIGGLEVSWDQWKTMESGTLLSTAHQAMGIQLPLVSDVRAWNE